MDTMSRLAERMPHTMALPRALGTGIIIRTSAPLSGETQARIRIFADEYERCLSRFRPDSPVSAMREDRHGGTFFFPNWATPLFDLYDRLGEATDGAIDPCVGEDLTRLGYGADLSFVMEADADGRLGSVHGRPTWRDDVERHGGTLVTKRPVSLDFGACGKGYLVDLLATFLGSGEDAGRAEWSDDEIGRESRRENGEMGASRADGNETESACWLIDAGGDLRVHSPGEPITIGLEDPADPTKAVGVAEIDDGAFCASAPSRRHWGEAAGQRLHHLINAVDGRPASDVAATWVAVPSRTSAEPPTALADGLATALFVVSPERLRARFVFDCAVMRPDRTASISRGFPGNLFAC